MSLIRTSRPHRRLPRTIPPRLSRFVCVLLTSSGGEPAEVSDKGAEKTDSGAPDGNGGDVSCYLLCEDRRKHRPSGKLASSLETMASTYSARVDDCSVLIAVDGRCRVRFAGGVLVDLLLLSLLFVEVYLLRFLVVDCRSGVFHAGWAAIRNLVPPQAQAEAGGDSQAGRPQPSRSGGYPVGWEGRHREMKGN